MMELQPNAAAPAARRRGRTTESAALTILIATKRDGRKKKEGVPRVRPRHNVVQTQELGLSKEGGG